MKQINFKLYTQSQSELFLSRLNEFIPQNTPACIVYQVVKELGIDDIVKSYKYDGCSDYHLRILLKSCFAAI